MSKTISESDTGSLCGDLIDIALGSDIDGLSDREVELEIEALTDTDDGINVTIKKGIKPNYNKVSKPKMASVIVVPDNTQRTINDLLAKPGRAKTNETSNKSNRNGSAKRVARKNKTKNESTTSLVSLLSNVKIKSNEVGNVRSSTPKRTRSTDSNENEIGEDDNPPKLLKVPGEDQLDQTIVPIVPSTEGATYRDIVIKSLYLKVCVAEREPAGKDLPNIQAFLLRKIEEALLQDNFIPTFNDCEIGEDGVYVVCSDYSSAKWLYEITDLESIPIVNAKVTVIPQDQTVQLEIRELPVRTVSCIQTRQNNNFILAAFARQNKNLNTGKWRIRSRRYQGATKTIIFMRMDRESFESIGKQGNKINWLLGTVDIELERRQPKPTKGNLSPGANQATGNGKSLKGKPNTEPSSKEVMGAGPKASGLIRKDGSTRKGKPQRNQ